MAWHSGKPADSDFLSASVQHIRENFAELEPLHPHVAELTDLTALHPHITELVDLTALHPHIAALLWSRIIDHNLDVPNPPNGWYVRWENGLQLCFNTTETFTFGAYSSGAHTTLSFPAQFSTLPYNIQVSLVRDDTDFSAMWQLTIGAFRESVSQFQLLYSNGNPDVLIARVAWSAWGMWK